MIHRIRSRSVFSRIRREGAHFRSGPLSCTMIRDDSLPGPAVGYAIGRSFGTAVERNRLRRQLRELVKVREDALPKGFFVFGASPKAAGARCAALGHHLDRLITHMAQPGSRLVSTKGRPR